MDVRLEHIRINACIKYINILHFSQAFIYFHILYYTIIIIIIIIMIMIMIMIMIIKITHEIKYLDGAVTKTYVNWLVCSGFRNEYRLPPSVGF